MKETVDIEWFLEWAYRVQKVVEAGTGAASACLDVGSALGRLGSGGGGGGAARLMYGSAVHHDAELLHGLVMRAQGKGGMSSDARALIINHARTGSRPDWLPGARPGWAARLSPNGREVGVYDDARNKVGVYVVQSVLLRAPDGSWMIKRGWPHSRIGFMRAQYGLWWAALDWLAKAAARMDFDDHVVIGPSCTAKPWEDVMGSTKAA